MEHFGDRLRQALADKNMTRQELAYKTMISEASIYLYLNNGATPSAIYLKQICEVLNVSADYLLGLGEHKNGSIH